MRLTVTFTLTAFAALTFSTSASAQDAATCPDGTVPIVSAGGPLCVEAIYVDPASTVQFVDPATCTFGYYQGSCAPEPLPPVDLGVAAYTFQTPDPAVAHAPAVVRPAAAIMEPVIGKVALFRSGLDRLFG